MRILFFSNWFPPVQSGSSYYTSSLAQALSSRGHDVAVVTLDWGKEFAPPSGLPFPVYQLPVLKIPKLSLFYNLKLMGFAFTSGNCKRLKAILQEHSFEILHHVNHIFDSIFLSAAAARSAGIPVVGSITTPIQHQNIWKQKIMETADRLFLGSFGVQKWDAIVSLDRTVHEYVGRAYGKKTQQRSVVIPFGVRMESMADYEGRPEINSSTPQILMVGHIHPFRNPVQLVRAMPLVLKEFPNAQLILSGRVDLEEPVKVAKDLGLIPAHVHFLGETPHAEVVRLMKMSAVFASWVTGPYHSLGTAPMEAMLCQTPVINDLPEDLFGPGKLKDGENIVLVNSRSPESIASAICRLLRDENLQRRIGAGGRRFVLDHLSWEKIAAEMEQLYEKFA